MQLILVRHGLPERIENAGGPADPPLTKVGRQQAEAAAQWLKTEALSELYVSPMVRARQTAEPLERALGREAIVERGVREFDAEESSYIPVEELQQDKKRWKKYLAEESTVDRSAFSAEVVDALEAIVAANRGGTVAVVCHGGVINVWAAHILGLAPKMFINPTYTSINRFMAASSGERSIVSLNETAHLRSI